MQEKLLVKIKHKNLIRMQQLLSHQYKQLINKLYTHFELSPKTYYHLYYQQYNSNIPITNQNSFQSCLSIHSPKIPKLFLQTTQDPKLHFTGNPSQVKQFEKRNIELQELVDKLKQQMKAKLEDSKSKMIEKMKKQLAQQLGRRQSKAMNDAVHYGFKCSACQAKDIKGVRYQCAICNYHLCQPCQKTNKYHLNHPFIKIKHTNIQLIQKNNTLISEAKINKSKQKSQSKQQKFQLINPLMQFLSLSEEQALKLIREYPKKSLDELMEICLSK